MQIGRRDIVEGLYLKADFAAAKARLSDLLREAPIPNSELAENSGLQVSPRMLRR